MSAGASDVESLHRSVTTAGCLALTLFEACCWPLNGEERQAMALASVVKLVHGAMTFTIPYIEEGV